jgi:hypothetical protein
MAEIHLMEILHEELKELYRNIKVDKENPDRNPPREWNIHVNKLIVHWWYTQPLKVKVYFDQEPGRVKEPLIATFDLHEPDSIEKLLDCIANY